MERQALIVQPNLVLGRVITNRLHAESCNVYVAHDYGKALALLRSRQFDLVVTCPYLGPTKGDQFAKRIKTLQPKTPIILVTDASVQVTALPFIAATIHMPDSMDELTCVIERLLLRKQVGMTGSVAEGNIEKD